MKQPINNQLDSIGKYVYGRCGEGPRTTHLYSQSFESWPHKKLL